MSNLNNNTAKLEALLATVNALPDAGVQENLNNEISTQTALLADQGAKIAELTEILSNKASGGNASGGNGFEDNTDTCDIQITSDYFIGGIGYYGTDGHKVWNYSTTSASISAICGSVVYIIQSGFYSATVSSGEILGKTYGNGITYRVPATPTSITINITTD